MIDLTGVQHHPAMQEIVSVLQNKTQNTDFGFFRVEVAYFFSKMAACMRAVVVTKDRGDIPVNIYAIGLASSGYGKGHSVNIMETEFLGGFRKRFVEQTMAVKAEENLHRIAKEMADKSVGTTSEITEDDAFAKVMARYDRKGPYLFTFDGGTMPAVKQLRQKLLMADCGSVNLQMDEIGLNLTNNVEVLTVYLEMYDQGLVKEKLIKNTEENQRDDEMVGKTPTNMLLFGTPTKLFDGGMTEDQFFAFLDTGYARRCLFGWGETSRKSYEDQSGKTLKDEAAEVFANLISPQNNALVAQWAAKFTDLADPMNFGWKMTVEDDVAIKLIEYKLACEKAAKVLPDHEEIKKAELSHRYFKALKLAGAYAFIDKSVEVEMEHLLQAILLVEESGAALAKMLKREKTYVKLAKYIASCGTEVTHADLDEALPFYKRSSRHETMQMAQAWGARHHMLIKKAFRDGIEFFSGDTLKETDLSQLVISYSDNFAYSYKADCGPFDGLHKVMLLKDYNWCNHHFRNEHRSEDTAIPGFNMVVLDVDKGTKLVQAYGLMKQYKFFIYTTKRHQQVDPATNTNYGDRFRMVFPIKYNLSLDADDYKEFMANIMAWLPFEIDDQANQRSRKWQSNELAAAAPGYHYYNMDGEVLDPLKFIPKTVKNDQFHTEFKAIENYSNLERWFAQRYVSGNRSNMLVRFALALVDGGLKLQDVEKAVYAFNDKVTPNLAKSEIQATVFKTVAKRYAQQKP